MQFGQNQETSSRAKRKHNIEFFLSVTSKFETLVEEEYEP